LGAVAKIQEWRQPCKVQILARTRLYRIMDVDLKKEQHRKLTDISVRGVLF
jgi:hypothetical protein